MVTIAHISDLHCSKTSYGKIGFRAKKLISCIKEINKLLPDFVGESNKLSRIVDKIRSS
ncbi:hypothetical protein KY360_01790 [Candidatus Woesearchaeota archaeon]|nr:hypothetical protein [Candidatus Woesearchaeota archaeon]